MEKCNDFAISKMSLPSIFSRKENNKMEPIIIDLS